MNGEARGLGVGRLGRRPIQDGDGLADGDSLGAELADGDSLGEAEGDADGASD